MDLKMTRIINATLAMMMTSTSVYAGTTSVRPSLPVDHIILAQAECDPAADPNCKPAEAPRAKPQPEPQAEPAPAPEPKAAPEPQAEPAQEPAPKPRRKAEPQTETPAEPAQEPQAEPAPKPRQKAKPQAEAPAEPAQEPAAEPAQEPAPKHKAKPQAEAPVDEQPAPVQEAPAVEKPAAEAPAEQPPTPEAPAKKHPKREPAAGKPAEQKPAEQVPGAPTAETPAVPTPAEQPAPAPDAPATEQPAAPGAQPVAPTGEEPAVPAGEQPATPSDEQSNVPAGEMPAQPAPNDGKQAPLFDSQKRQPPAGQATGEKPAGQAPAQGAEQAAQPPAAPPAPPPVDDKAAQQETQPVEIVPVTQEKGTRRRDGENNRPPEQRPEGANVLRELGNRVIIEVNNNVIVQSDERPRMGRGARDVYYEDLPRGRVREVIVRDNGVQVVTIRNQYGDVVRRSRIMPDGREYVLTYVDDDEGFDRGGWRDPGDDLPPMNVDIGYDDYILDSERAAGDPEAYYDFLREPPVEKVRRLYSVDEVKRSARVRDIARRVDLDTIKFAFGKADVPEDQIAQLDGVAKAMEKLLKANPAETFLIEGHTDAVGSPEANLALSDRRAEAVADALTNVFGIPPENLSTQGYGEQYLKVRTQAPNQENRRVAIRRITSLVAPVASAN